MGVLNNLPVAQAVPAVDELISNRREGMCYAHNQYPFWVCGVWLPSGYVDHSPGFVTMCFMEVFVECFRFVFVCCVK